MTSIIKTSVLRAAVLSAFDLGRYTVAFGVNPSGEDLAVVPASIMLDLAERDDDLLGREPTSFVVKSGIFTAEEFAAMENVFGHDDHGPAIPAQGEHYRSAEIVGVDGPWAVREAGPRIYEFALQEARRPPWADALTLDKATVLDAPDAIAANTAEWVHVYDRVTRERRTLKRPTDPVVVKGMADVAADLRGKPVYDPRVDPMPPVGPLASTEGLKAGDVLRVIDGGYSTGLTDGQIVTALEPKKPGYVCHSANKLGHFPDRFAFVGRPDSDGWMDWPGGENPVGDAKVNLIQRGCHRDDLKEWGGEHQDWLHRNRVYDIVRFRLVDTPPATSDT